MPKNRYEEFAMPLIAEFVGQVIFAFIHCMASNLVETNDAVKGSPTPPALAMGTYVIVIVLVYGPISAAHFNAAVTVGITLSGGLKLVMFVPYIIAQLLGATAGAGLALVVSGEASGAFEIREGISIGQAVLCEVILTFHVVFAILMSAFDHKSPICCLAIGLSVMSGIFGGFAITGPCMNPSLSFGTAIVSGKWKNYWVFWVGPVTGGMMASFLQRSFLGNREKRLIFFKDDEVDDQSQVNDSKRRGGEDVTGNNIHECEI